MIESFLLHAGIAGILVAAIAGPLGCFVVWRGMAFFGDTLAHSALLGAALAIALDINATWTVFAVALSVAGLLLFFGRRGDLGTDTLLGLLSHGALAVSLVAIAMMTGVRLDLFGYLFGDILAVGTEDLIVIALGVAGSLAVLAWIWRPLLAATVSPQIATAEGLHPKRARLVFTFLLAALIAMAMKLVGALLITALLIIPAAAARRISGSPESMAVFAAVIGMISVGGGLGLSVELDTPAGPSIVVVALVLFLAGHFTRRREVRSHG